MQNMAQHAVVDLFSGSGAWAMGYRSIAAAAADGAIYYATNAGLRSVMGADIFSNVMVFITLSSVDIFRYYNGDPNMPWDVLVGNFAENASGCAFGVTGGVIGAALGSLVCPGVGTVIGSILVGMIFDFMGRVVMRYLIPKNEQSQLESEARKLLHECAEICHVNVNKDSYKTAKGMYHHLLRQKHTDKHSSASDEETARLTEECTKLIQAWGLVRKHYEDTGKISVNEPEGFVDIWVHKIRKSANDAWILARTWFSTKEGPDLESDELNDYRKVRVLC